MQAPCETMGKRILPSVRSAIVSYMYKDLGLTQLKIAKILGVSQSSISRYLNNQRGTWRAYSVPGLEDKVKEIAKLLVEGKIDRREVLCEVCRYIRSNYPEVLAGASRRGLEHH